ncbi:hypothetical protein [Photobacterium leiognathi]|uniref:hypothetical protein n=1 Tax=Photobacterium leiognathi TaxID=553611 RepID=UPI0027333AD3|nr:hypothetical protein [Photobacterium leiognathi]
MIFFYNRVDENKSNSFILNDFNAKVRGLTSVILSKQEVNRFGMVARYFHLDKSSIFTLKKKFFSNAVDGAEELGLRFNKPTEFHGFKINDIIEVSAAEMQLNGVNHKGILIQRDINNNPNSVSSISQDTLTEISAKYSSKVSELEIERLIK